METKARIDEALPAPPSLMKAIIAGFDAVAAHISLILFPLALDLILWFGPHLKVGKIFMPVIESMGSLTGFENSQETTELLQINKELLTFIVERFNVLSILRTYPVGVPSLMASRLPVEAPGIQPLTWDIDSFLILIIILGTLLLVGILIGVFYYISVSKAALYKKFDLLSNAREWPRASLQVLVLAIILLALFMAISIPASCVLTALALGSPSLSNLGALLYIGFLLWLAFPLLLSTHGIFANNDNAINSVRRSVRVTRMTLPGTGLFFLVILVISQGLDILWGSPSEKSWFAAVGVAGHAFVTTALLAASFVYYKEADHWVQTMILRLRAKSTGRT